MADNQDKNDKPAAKNDPKRKDRFRTGVAVGIGSAAIVAALLYSNRGKKGDRGGNG